MIKFREEDIRYLAVELPDEIKYFKYSGDFAGERAAIAKMMKKDLPYGVRKRLEIEDAIADEMQDNYKTDFDGLLAKIRRKYPLCEPENLEHIIDLGNADYIRKNGERYFENAAASNIFSCNGRYLKSLSGNEPDPESPNALRHENLRIMREKGYRRVRITVEEHLTVDRHAERPGEKIRVHLPYPCENEVQSDIELISSSHPVYIGNSGHRTAFIETEYKSGDDYFVRFAYTLTVPYFKLDPALVSADQPDFYTGEKLPQIRLTPAIRTLAEELKGDETNRLILARRAYDWVTTHVVYSYMREYLCIDNIPEFAMLNGRGDCGVQALLFICLCRAMGVPARWQSGSHARPTDIGSHDWAQFYVAPWGWLWADPSVGGGALRSGDRELWDHYFGNFDTYREINCTDIQETFDPPKNYMRIDPN
ncbi:MAG: transglutaminase-like domain-containing protein, partial [Clostridia bacterium]|nr:transglutaminase-like domain-containing protein [Clostridia bacterium]